MGERVGVAEDLGEGMQCSDHPYRNNPGGICAFCLQEKLGKLVSSSKSSTFFPISPTVASSAPPPLLLPPSSSSSSPSLDAAIIFSNNTTNATANPIKMTKKKKNSKVVQSGSSAASIIGSDANLILKRSRSVAVPRHLDTSSGSDDSPRKKSFFWSFLHLSRHRTKHQQLPSSSSCLSTTTSADRKEQMINSRGGETKRDFSSTGGPGGDESPNSSSHTSSSSFGRKVARSRSVGCGSRSFSGDLLERISTGLGDCALRRVESQREAKPKMDQGGNGIHHRSSERVKCGGIFGMMITSASSTASSSSSYWLQQPPSSSEDFNAAAAAGGSGLRTAPNGRNRSTSSWGWAFASPIRAFTRPSSSSHINNNTKSYISTVAAEQQANAAAGGGGSGSTTSNNPTRSNPNHHLGASPSLLAVRG